MLRHGCDYALINKGYAVRIVQDYLGHKDIRDTAIYTRLDSKQLEGALGLIKQSLLVFCNLYKYCVCVSVKTICHLVNCVINPI